MVLLFIALGTRRPILADMASSNFFTYAPESAEFFDRILKEIYGIDLLMPPPLEFRHREIPYELYRDLWQNRTLAQWQIIGEDFKVTDILVDQDWELQLPIVAQTQEKRLYEIPRLMPQM